MTIDVERIRVAAERELAPAVDRLRLDAAVPVDVASARRNLQARAIRLTPTMAPDAFAELAEVRRILGVTQPVTLYQSPGSRNACVHYWADEWIVELVGGVLVDRDAGALRATLGHEIAHYLAHAPGTRWSDLWRRCVSRPDLLFGPSPPPEMRSFVMATELTADRFGLIACADLDAALRVEMRAATGLPEGTLTWDTKAYLAQAREVCEERLDRDGSIVGVSHPEHYVRAYADWLFSETDVYAELTGKGRASRTLKEVDATLSALLGVATASSASGSARSPDGSVIDFDLDHDDILREVVRGVDDTVDSVGRFVTKATPEVSRFVSRTAPTVGRLADRARDGLSRWLGGSDDDDRPTRAEDEPPAESTARATPEDDIEAAATKLAAELDRPRTAKPSPATASTKTSKEADFDRRFAELERRAKEKAGRD